MPKFFKEDVFKNQEPILDPEHELPSGFDIPELESPHPQREDFGEGGHDFFNDYMYDPVRTLIAWRAPSRPYRRKDRSYYTTVIILVILVSLIAFFFGERLLIGVFLALLFLLYVLNFTPPEEIEYKITNQGITIGDHFYHWQQLDSFWFSEKEGFKVLSVLTLVRFPGILIAVLVDTPEEEVKRIIARFLPFHEIAPKSLIEKWTESIQKHFPLENPHK